MAFCTRSGVLRQLLRPENYKIPLGVSIRNSSAHAEQRTQTDQHTHNNDDEELKIELLNLAMKHVNTKGWSYAAIEAGANEMGMSTEVSNIFREYDLVKHFLETNNNELEVHLRQQQVSLTECMDWKLQQIIPYAPRLHEALAFASQPANVSQSVKLLQSFADIVAHYSLLDKSTDISWYTKRMGIASLYVATELHLLQDKSPNYDATKEFLHRRLSDFLRIQQGSALPFLNSLPEVFSIGCTAVFNILGRSRERTMK